MSFDEAVNACRLDNRGAILELATESLREDGWDVAPIRGFDERELASALDEGIPPILIIRLERSERMAHAVVLCALDEHFATVMDPSVGDYIKLPRTVISGLSFDESVYGTLRIGGMSE